MPRQADLARRVEEACLNGWPALRHVVFDGWLLRFADGHTRRSNSVNPLAPSRCELRRKIAYCEILYARASLPTIFRISSNTEPGLDGALDSLGYGDREDETCVIHSDFTRHPPDRGAADLIEGAPSEAWLEAYARCSGNHAAREAHRKILHALAVPAVFAAARASDGRLASLAFGAVHERIVCVNLVVTDPALRGQGLSRRTVSAVLSWARERAGAEGACLPVVASNTAAVALYHSLGFDAELYRYHYRRRASA